MAKVDGLKQEVEILENKLQDRRRQQAIDKAKLQANIKNEIAALGVMSDVLQDVIVMGKCVVSLERDKFMMQLLKSSRIKT